MSQFTDEQYAFFVRMYNNQNKIEQEVQVPTPKPAPTIIIPRRVKY